VAQGIRQVEHAEPGSGFRLHHISADVSENENLIEARPDVAERLTALHDNWARTFIQSS